jgi:hypothetical protein
MVAMLVLSFVMFVFLVLREPGSVVVFRSPVLRFAVIVLALLSMLFSLGAVV